MKLTSTMMPPRGGYAPPIGCRSTLGVVVTVGSSPSPVGDHAADDVMSSRVELFTGGRAVPEGM